MVWLCFNFEEIGNNYKHWEIFEEEDKNEVLMEEKDKQIQIILQMKKPLKMLEEEKRSNWGKKARKYNRFLWKQW